MFSPVDRERASTAGDHIKVTQTAVSWAKWLTLELPFLTRTDEIGFVLMCITISVSRSFTFPLKTSRENAQELRYTTSRAMYTVESDPNSCKLLKMVNFGALVFYEYRPDGCHLDVHHHHRESIFHNETSTLNVLPCGSRTSINSRRPHKSDPNSCKLGKMVNFGAPVFYEYRSDRCHLDVHHHQRERIFQNKKKKLNFLPCGQRTNIENRRTHVTFACRHVGFSIFQIRVVTFHQNLDVKVNSKTVS
jgi:hypothetical protein